MKTTEVNGITLTAILINSVTGDRVYVHDVWTTFVEALEALSPEGWEWCVMPTPTHTMAGWVKGFKGARLEDKRVETAPVIPIATPKAVVAPKTVSVEVVATIAADVLQEITEAQDVADAAAWMHQEMPESWPKPTSNPTTVIRVKSDSSDEVYEVSVIAAEDRAVKCTCKAGERGQDCKHLFRARVKAAGTWKSAHDALITEGLAANSAGVMAMYKNLLKYVGTNGAIAELVEQAFGTSHPHATLPPSPRGPVEGLALYRES